MYLCFQFARPDYFIHHFKTYETILTDIKNEYEVTIAEQRQLIEQLEPLKTKISLCHLETKKEVDRMRREALEEAYRLRCSSEFIRDKSVQHGWTYHEAVVWLIANFTGRKRF
jgi:hypothetical protein